jgi:tripartite-type tricarboxylate transporter receptor subunit TctC
LGCEDAPPSTYIIVGPKGIPDEIYKRISEAFKKVADGADFQDLLEKFDLPYDFKDGTQLEKIVKHDYEWYRIFLKKFGATKD